MADEWETEYSFSRVTLSKPPRFVKASGSGKTSPPKTKTSGIEAQAIYNDVVAGPSSTTIEDLATRSPIYSYIEPLEAGSAKQERFCSICNITFEDECTHFRSISHLLNADKAPVKLKTFYKLGENTRGYRMLQKGGWSDSEVGLGSSGQGRLVPLKSSEKFDRLGVGLKKISQEVAAKESRSSLNRSEFLQRGKRDRLKWQAMYKYMHD